MRTAKATTIRHARILTTATMMALVLLWLSPHARAATAEQAVDEAPRGALYASGELLVTYEPAASEQDMDEAVQESGARVEEELPEADAQLLSFPEVRDERSEEAREEELERAEEVLERDPDVQHVDYNYLREPDYAPNDSYFVKGREWDVRSPSPCQPAGIEATRKGETR